MKVLYFDCPTGIAGDMTIGALLEILGDDKYFLDELKKLNVDGYKIDISRQDSHGIMGTHLNVVVDGEDEYGHYHDLDEHKHDHEHNHPKNHRHEHRNLLEVNKIIDDSTLDQDTKKLAKDIFFKVAEAESKVHGKALSEIHFHEVGAVDSIVDIVGTAILINKIKPDKIYSSVLNEGRGVITCAHGQMSVPVPATLEILANNNVKFRQIDVDTELVTPTGAAIITTLAQSFGNMPEMTLKKVGFGVGSKDIGMPNCLKVYYGEIDK